MNASLKSIPGHHLHRMQQLESKISDLQNQYQLLLKERQKDLTTLLSMVDIAHLDDPILLGGLLFIKEKTTSQDAANKSLVEAWRETGEKFLRRRKSRVCSSESGGDCLHPREHKEAEQAGASLQPQSQQKEGFPQIPSKKITTSKQTATPETAPQPPQK